MMGFALFGACASGPIERQHLADGSWQLICQVPMDGCVREIEKVCRNKRYVILHGQSDTRLRDAPPFATEYHTNHLTFMCEDDAARAAKGASCTPGATQACVGAGACAGGQACRPDGSGFTSCDCGLSVADGGATSSDAGSKVQEGGIDSGAPDAAGLSR